MNLLARILSHGFAFVVVALLFLVLVYRGDLFQEGELPDFLSFEHPAESTQEAGTAAAGGASDQQKEEDAGKTAALPEASGDSTPAPAPAVTASDGEMPAAATGPTAAPDTTPDNGQETAARPAEDVEPDKGSDTVMPDSEPAPVKEGGSRPPPAPVSLDSTGNIDEPADETTVTQVDESQDETNTAVETDTESIHTGDEDVTETTDATTPTTTDDTVTAMEAQAVSPDSSDARDSGDAGAAVAVVDTTVPTARAPLETTTEASIPEATSPAASEPPEAAGTAPSMMESLAAPADREAPQTTTRTVADAPYKVLAKARESFWLRDFDTAEQQYRRLTQLEPDNPDGYGELGNMYFSQGKWDAAAAAYYEAGLRLLSEGLVPQAREMLEVIRGLNGPQASDLEVKIAEATATSP